MGPTDAGKDLRRRAKALLEEIPILGRTLSELARIELLDRSLALGAQALLALIPLMMVVGAFLPADWGEELSDQVASAIGVGDDVMGPIEEVTAASGLSAQDVGWVSLFVALASASSFARALQRMYARVWDLPAGRGLGVIRRSLLWIAGWIVIIQLMALLLRSFSDAPLTRMVHVSLQLAMNIGLWWWTAHLLLGARVSWRSLLPGAVVSAVLVVVLSLASRLVMPRYARVNLEQFGPLGVVFAIASWLVVFGGVLVLAAVIGRHLAEPGPFRRALRRG